MSTVSTVSTVSIESTVSAVYSAVLPPALMVLYLTREAAKVSFSKALRVPWRQRPIINTLSLCKEDGRKLQDSFILQQNLERKNGFNEQRNCLLAAHNFAKYPFKKTPAAKVVTFLLFDFQIQCVAADQEYNKNNLF